jgi:hypothetical protein
VERVVAHSAKVYKRENLGMHGVGKSWWTSLPIHVVCLSTTFLNFKYEPPFFVYVEIGTSTKMIDATSSTFGFDQRNNLL